jgi:phenylalanyl-tRNA synthetase beta chain
MKLSEQWLREWVNPPLAVIEIGEQLTMAGIEIESITPASEIFSKVVVGEIVKAEQHPNADRLRVCEVNVGANETLTIVCGAKNARAGIKVATALVGAELPNGLLIKAAKLRGVESSGMLCSETELGLPKTIEGIIELPADAPVGADLREYLNLNDNIIEINLTPNRADCLSTAGIAREIAAINSATVTEPKITEISATIQDALPINIEAEAACPHYVGRIIRNIKVDAATPIWMQERLRKSGIKSISPVVDITNYVMLELGQPLHAFDLVKLNKEINVRYATNNEVLTLLDGQQLALNDKMLVIADAKKPLALAGIMGGIDSGIGAATKDLFLESAFFTPVTLINTIRHFNLHTESSHRFERGVDPSLQLKAMHRLTNLLLEIVGGQPGPIIEAVHAEYLPKLQPIKLRSTQVKKLLGISIPDQEIENILCRLGMQVGREDLAPTWQITPPSHRFDITLEVDLIEELARIYGYNKIPTANCRGAVIAPKAIFSSNVILAPLKVRSILVNAGYHEALTYSFVAADLQELLDHDHKPIVLKNPVNKELAVMRTNLWPGLISAYLYNVNRQQNRIRLFEIGNCFVPQHNQLQQNLNVGFLAAGDLYPEQWGTAKKATDFFDIKHDIELIFNALGIAQDIHYQSLTHSALHPGCCTGIFFKNKLIGHIGELHPSIIQKLEITQKIYLVNFDLDGIEKTPVNKFSEISKFPAITRDLAVIVDQQLPAQELITKIQSKIGKSLRSVKIFDIYQGEGIEKNKKSIALKFVFQHNDHTLTDEEIEQAMQQILVILENQFDAKLRG